MASPELTQAYKTLLLHLSGEHDLYRLVDVPITHTVFSAIQRAATRSATNKRVLHFDEKPALKSKVGTEFFLRLRLSSAHHDDEAYPEKALLAPWHMIVDWTVDTGRQDFLELLVLRTEPGASILTVQFPSTAEKYVLDVADLRAHPSCILNNVQEMRAQETGDSSETSTTLTCWSHAQFEVVYRALTNLPVTLGMMRAGCEALQFFGIPLRPVFQRTVTAQPAGSRPLILATHDITSSCSSDGIDLADSAKAMGLPWVRFTATFSDGDITYLDGEEYDYTDGEEYDDGYGREPAEPVHVQPTWLWATTTTWRR